MKPKQTLPSPDMLLLEARGAIGRDAPLNVDLYASVIGELRDGKNYSFGKIAEWLGERVGREINKGIIYRVYTEWAERRASEEPDLYEPQEPSEDEQYEQVVAGLADDVVNYTLERAKAAGCSGSILNEALERASRILEQAQADEKLAAEADAGIGEGKK